MKLIFRNVKVVRVDGVNEEDIFVQGGIITGPFDFADKEIDGRGKFLLPGVIDPHVHFREPGAAHKETWESGSAAAAMGGVTTVLDMPNNEPPIISSAALEAKRTHVKGRSYVNYGFHFGAAGIGNIEEIEKVQNVPAIKIYMGSSTGNLLVDKAIQWEKVFEVCKEKNIPVIVHAENEARIQKRSKIFLEESHVQVHSKIRDCECAKIAICEALSLQEKIGNKLHIAHMSCKAELEELQARQNPLLTCEVAPHHLYFTVDDMKDGFLKMNPPLRQESDLIALWEALRGGSINCIATDHAPHTKEEKSKGLASPSGVPGVEFSLPLMLNEVSQNMLDLSDVVRLMAAEPARIFSLKSKGGIEEFMDADLVLVDMEMEKCIKELDIFSACAWSPYVGYTLKGWPIMTVVKGNIVMENGKLTGEKKGEEVIVDI